jgi:benzoate transport
MNKDPRRIIDESPMSRLQVIAVGITVALNALDGFDVLSISFAAPGIAKEWGIDRGQLGIVLSMELIGMAFGSVLLGGLADKIGRRRMMLGCLALMAVGMFMATTVGGIVALSAWRLVTGLGIGGMLATINAVAAESSNLKRRNLSLALMTIGYPLGAVVGGTIASLLLQGGEWRSVFVFGAIVTACMIPLVYFFVPEPIHYLVERRPAGALERINRTLKRMGHAAVDALPEVRSDAPKRSIADILKPGLIATTLLVTFGYFAHIMTFYFILKWSPKIVADMGFAASAAGTVLVWANVGGATGGAIFGFLAQKFDVRRMTVFALAVSGVAVALFGAAGATSLTSLSILACFSGLFTNSAVVGYYTIFARAFPTHVRATGTGFAIGVGRGGAALSPIIAGYLFQAGAGLPTVAIAMGFGSLFSALALFLLPLRYVDTPAAEEPDEVGPAPA